MAEIYRALSNLRMQWKIINTYHLRAKYEYAEGFEVKIELQLYRLDSENYLVDFKYVGQQSAAEMQAHAEFMRRLNEEAHAQAYAEAEARLGRSQDSLPSTSTTTTTTTTTTEAEAEAEATASDTTEGTEPITTDTLDARHPEVAVMMAEGADLAPSGPQDIPSPPPGHHLGKDSVAELHLSSTAPLLRTLPSRHHPHANVTFQTQGATAAAGKGDEGSHRSTHAATTPETASLRAVSPMALASTSLPVSTITGPGILSSSLRQERQYLKDLNELRQEMKHQQRQRDLKQRPTHLLFPKVSYQLASSKDVTSPFPFFDVCGKLITELAIGSG